MYCSKLSRTLLSATLSVMLITGLSFSSLLSCHSTAKAASQKTAAELISGAPQDVPVSGKVTMVDIGAHACIPCKMMKPVLKTLSQKYDGKAAIVFIDVWQHREEAQKYGISVIPTQIFYNANGDEVYRHVGFLGQEAIEAKLQELGVR